MNDPLNFHAKREYPKRMEVARWNKNWEKWQAFYDRQYEKECRRLGVPYEPKLGTYEQTERSPESVRLDESNAPEVERRDRDEEKEDGGQAASAAPSPGTQDGERQVESPRGAGDSMETDPL